MKKFEIGKTYSMRSICDYDCVWTYTVTSRTEKTVALADEKGNVKKFKISGKVSEWNGAESVYPLGRYSMCPILTA